MDFRRMKVKSIFGLKFEKNLKLNQFKNKYLLITQKSLVSELFDFAILIKNENEIILKLIQVSTRKSIDDLL